MLDAAPLTPMEQQIISELGATDAGVSAADADKADPDPADDMLDVLVSQRQLTFLLYPIPCIANLVDA